MIKIEPVDYRHGAVNLEGTLAYDSRMTEPRPCVLIAHAWSGRSEFFNEKARELALLGYVGFAMDVYGKGVLGNTNEENTELMRPLIEDRQLLRARLTEGFKAACQLPMVNAQKIAAIGFCFGGLCVLDMARMGTDLKGVVSFHGILQSAEHLPTQNIKAKVLALHGHDDPMVKPEKVLEFETEMTKNKADWQLHVFGNTMHAFMNPEANDPAFGTVYNPETEKRAWLMMRNFLQEIFE